MSGFIGGVSGHQGALRSAFLLRFKASITKESFIATNVVIAVFVDVVRLAVYCALLSWSEIFDNPSHPYTQALLAAQMIGVHHAVITFLYGATVQGQTFDGTDANVLRATRLMRLFNEQLEAMAKLKGKTGQQKVIVEHVHVHQGGQAIVGPVSAAKGNQGEGGR